MRRIRMGVKRCAAALVLYASRLFAQGQSGGEVTVIPIQFPVGASMLYNSGESLALIEIDNGLLNVGFVTGYDPLDVARQLCGGPAVQVKDNPAVKCAETVMKAYCNAMHCEPEDRFWECCTAQDQASYPSSMQNCTPCSLSAACMKLHDMFMERVCSIPGVLGGIPCSLQCPACFEGHTGSVPASIHVLSGAAGIPQILVGTICEVGFNAGHSAVSYLSRNPYAHIVAFDLGHHHYTAHAFTELQHMFPHATLELVLGDSKRSLRDYAIHHPGFRCNLLFVDGDHSFDGAVADLRYMATLADPTFHLLIVDDATDANVSRAWQSALDGGWVNLVDDDTYLSEYIPNGGFTPTPGAGLNRADIKLTPDGSKLTGLTFDPDTHNMFIGRFTSGAIDQARRVTEELRAERSRSITLETSEEL